MNKLIRFKLTLLFLSASVTFASTWSDWEKGGALQYSTFTPINLAHPISQNLRCYSCLFTSMRIHAGLLKDWDLRQSSLFQTTVEQSEFIRLNARGIKAPQSRWLNCKLSHADLRGANLSRSFLESLDLSSAQLIGADLSFALIKNTDLSGADLSQALLLGTRFMNIQVDKDTRWPKGFTWPQL